MATPPDQSSLNPKHPSFVIADELRRMRNEQAKLALQSAVTRAIIQEQPEDLLMLTFAIARWLHYQPTARITDEFIDLSAGIDHMRMH